MPRPVEVRVFVNEVRSAPGYAVSVDTYDETVPVIYIQPDDPARNQAPQAPEQRHEIFNDPI